MGCCAAPNCSKRTNKGFKLYSFPSNPERRKKWLSNTRWDKWEPTSNSKLCQVHFEESQFEANRADGLKKLKPNAIPSIFDTRPKANKSKARIIRVEADEESSNFTDPGEIICSKKPKKKQNKKKTEDEDPLTNSQVRAVSKKVVHKQKQTAVKRKRGRPRGRPPSKKVNVAARKRTARKRTSQVSISPPPTRNKGKKRGISPQPTVSPPRKVAKVVTGNWRTSKVLKESDTSSSEEDNVTTKEEKKCFVCEKQVSNGTHLGTLTTTSRAPMRHKLDRIAEGARGHLDLSRDPGGVLCSHCTCVLNHLDQIEVELNLLTKSVLNALLKKYGLATLVNDKGEVDENIEGTYLETGGDMENTNNHSDKNLATPDDEHSNSLQDSNKQTNNVNIKETPSKEYHCHVCFYTCNKKSLLVFHLRDHLKRNCHRCDFCNLYIEEGELHNHGNKQLVKPYVTLDRKDSANIQDYPNRLASETPKVLKVSENQAIDIYGSKERSSEKMSQNGDRVEVVEMPTKESIEKKCVTSSEMNYATDVSFVALPITGQSSHLITSTLSDLGGKHELEMLDYISSEMSSLIRTESDTIKSVLGDSKTDYIGNKCLSKHESMVCDRPQSKSVSLERSTKDTKHLDTSNVSNLLSILEDG